MQFCNLKKGEFATHNKFNILVRIGLSMLAKYLIIITDIPYYMLTLILVYLMHFSLSSAQCSLFSRIISWTADYSSCTFTMMQPNCIYLSILPQFLSFFLFFFLFFYLSILSIFYLFIFLSFYLSIILSFYLSIFLSFYLFIFLSFYLYFLYLSCYLPIYPTN